MIILSQASPEKSFFVEFGDVLVLSFVAVYLYCFCFCNVVASVRLFDRCTAGQSTVTNQSGCYSYGFITCQIVWP